MPLPARLLPASKATPVVATFPISVTVEDNTPSPSPVVSPSTSSSNLRIHQREHEAVHLIDALGNYQNDKNTQQSLASLEHSSDTRQAPAQPPLGPKQRTNWWFHRQDSVPPKPLTHSQLDVIPTDKLQQDASPVVDIATAPELQVTSLDITPADTNALPSTDHDSLKSSQALASPNKKAEAALASTEAALESANIGDSPDHVTDRIINWVPFLKSMPAPDPEHISHQLGSPGGRRRRRSPYHPTSQGHDNAHL
ncbi:hypothetical protein BZG36_00870 [Bifiguratus adelaidae]|uniref:Uncharacterized protein n=1 Tax=Bifiguratus adelaidae TaxID=1938954 RepID=A0A261Y5A8_9FUNG|nr:hypothetical protein BZG36_00870 [Bifiguratus adelaidae]